MKKLLAFGVLLLLSTISVLAANPLPLLLQAPQAYTVLKISDADLSAITAYAAAKQAEIIGQVINGLDIAQDIMVMPGVKNKIPMPKLKVGKGVRPYTGDEQFRVKRFKYTDRWLEVQVGVYEFRIDPEDYMNTYLAWVNSPGSSAAKTDIPFSEFLFNEVTNEVQSEYNDETAYYGFDKTLAVAFDAGDTYAVGDYVTFATATDNPGGFADYYKCITITTAGQSPDTHSAKWQLVNARAVAPGLESKILAGITASEISPVATGAITATDGVAIAAFNKLFRAWSVPYRKKGIIISCSQTDMDFLIDDILNKYSKYTREDLENADFIYLPNSNKKCIVKVGTWLGTSRRLVSGPSVKGQARHQNLYMGTDLESDITSLSVMKTELWRLKAGLKARIGFQIQDMAAIKVGDQA